MGETGNKTGQKRQICPNCGGTGDLGTFHGESRFVITHEECPFCCGFGYIFEGGENAPQEDRPKAPEQR